MEISAVDVHLSTIISSRTLWRIFIKFRIRVRYKMLLNQTNFHENWFSDSHLTGRMSSHFCHQSRHKVTLPTTTTVYFVCKLHVSVRLTDHQAFVCGYLKLRKKPKHKFPLSCKMTQLPVIY